MRLTVREAFERDPGGRWRLENGAAVVITGPAEEPGFMMIDAEDGRGATPVAEAFVVYDQIGERDLLSLEEDELRVALLGVDGPTLDALVQRMDLPVVQVIAIEDEVDRRADAPLDDIACPVCRRPSVDRRGVRTAPKFVSHQFGKQPGGKLDARPCPGSARSITAAYEVAFYGDPPAEGAEARTEVARCLTPERARDLLHALRHPRAVEDVLRALLAQWDGLALELEAIGRGDITARTRVRDIRDATRYPGLAAELTAILERVPDDLHVVGERKAATDTTGDLDAALAAIPTVAPAPGPLRQARVSREELRRVARAQAVGAEEEADREIFDGLMVEAVVDALFGAVRDVPGQIRKWREDGASPEAVALAIRVERATRSRAPVLAALEEGGNTGEFPPSQSLSAPVEPAPADPPPTAKEADPPAPAPAPSTSNPQADAKPCGCPPSQSSSAPIPPDEPARPPPSRTPPAVRAEDLRRLLLPDGTWDLWRIDGPAPVRVSTSVSISDPATLRQIREILPGAVSDPTSALGYVIAAYKDRGLELRVKVRPDRRKGRSRDRE